MDDLDMPVDRANMLRACTSWRVADLGATCGSCLGLNVGVLGLPVVPVSDLMSASAPCWDS